MRHWDWISLHRIGITAVLALGLLSALGCTPRQIVIDLAPRGDRLERTVVIDDGRWLGSERVALIDVSGLLVNGNQPRLIGAGPNPVTLLHEQLAQAAADDAVKAVILRVNTPGGTVTASDVMYREVQRFKQRTGKPVVALLMDVATSGGYYLACAGDHIVTYPTSITGSVGVILQTFSLEQAMARFGVQAEAITSGENKDATSLFSTMTDEQRAILQRLVDDFYQRFANVVRQRRPNIPQDRFARITDGRIMSGERAVELGLADETGDIYGAFDRAKAMAGIEQADLVRYHRPRTAVRSPYARAPIADGSAGSTQINLLQLNLPHLPGGDAPVGIYYLWRPETQ